MNAPRHTTFGLLWTVAPTNAHFFTSITPSLHVSLNCRWISIGFMPRKWRNRIITRCSSNVNVVISVSKTLLQFDLVKSIQRVVQCCDLASLNLKNIHVSSNNFHVSICFHSREKNEETLELERTTYISCSNDFKLLILSVHKKLHFKLSDTDFRKKKN